MKTLFTTDYKNYEPNWPSSSRPSARGIILIDNISDYSTLSPDDKIALAYSTKHQFYKFPGGIHKGEENTTALIKNQNLDDYEKDDGFELRIVTLDRAIQTNLRVKSEDYAKLDMIARETLVMEKLCGVDENIPRAFAEALLENGVAKNPGPWREHSYAVAQAAEKIAKATQVLNPDFAYTCGLLHDIGRQMGHTYIAHVYDGYYFLKNLGYDKLARICLTHSFNLHIIEDYIGKIDITDAQYEELKNLLAATEYDDYDRLIQLLDSTCGADGTKNMEARMNDVRQRYGNYQEGKWNKNFELKAYFEKMMGRGLYDVI